MLKVDYRFTQLDLWNRLYQLFRVELNELDAVFILDRHESAVPLDVHNLFFLDRDIGEVSCSFFDQIKNDDLFAILNTH